MSIAISHQSTSVKTDDACPHRLPQYRTKDIARHVQGKAQKHVREFLTAFRCPCCREWHVATKREREFVEQAGFIPLRSLSQCPRGKMRLLSRQDAEVEVARIVGKPDYSPSSGELQAYFCTPCHAWHTGHSNKGPLTAYVQPRVSTPQPLIPESVAKQVLKTSAPASVQPVAKQPEPTKPPQNKVLLDTLREFAALIEALRIKAGYNRSQLSAQAGVSVPSVCKLLVKKTDAYLDTLVKLLGALDYSLALVDRDDWVFAYAGSSYEYVEAVKSVATERGLFGKDRAALLGSSVVGAHPGMSILCTTAFGLAERLGCRLVPVPNSEKVEAGSSMRKAVVEVQPEPESVPVEVEPAPEPVAVVAGPVLWEVDAEGVADCPEFRSVVVCTDARARYSRLW